MKCLLRHNGTPPNAKNIDQNSIPIMQHCKPPGKRKIVFIVSDLSKIQQFPCTFPSAFRGMDNAKLVKSPGIFNSYWQQKSKNVCQNHCQLPKKLQVSYHLQCYLRHHYSLLDATHELMDVVLSLHFWLHHWRPQLL